MLYFDQYSERIKSISLQFEFARKAIQSYISANDPSYKPEEPKPLYLSALADEKGFEDIVHNAEVLRGMFPKEHKNLENTLAQNEIILTVAVFEDQMKAIHREVLRENPELLNPDRDIKLGKLIAFNRAKIIEEEIDRAVKALDRQSVAERAKAFEKLGLEWGRVEGVEEMTKLRNRILHEDTDIQVSGVALSSAFSTSILVPFHIFLVGEVIYPNSLDSGLKPEERAELKGFTANVKKKWEQRGS